MEAENRRKKIINILENSTKVISGTKLAQALGVTRQIIVQDIALLKANNYDILSTNRGYILNKQSGLEKVLKLKHNDDEIMDELYTIVDYGGIVKDVFVYHKVYGMIRADLMIKSRHDVDLFVEQIKTGKSFPLKNITSDYHYHTILVDDDRQLEIIKEKLMEKDFLAALRTYEPVDFWQEHKDIEDI